jgi:RimJ/RimL family protein N-acetyltransferase
MIEELPIAELAKYGARFPGPQPPLVIASIAAGNTSGRLWRLAGSGAGAMLLWDQGNNVFYLAGEHTSDTAHSELAALIGGPIRASAQAEGLTRFKARALSASLEAALPALFEGVTLRELPELLYRYEQPHAPEVSQPQLEGLNFAPIDRALLARTDLENDAPLREEIVWMWSSEARFLELGYGYAALAGRRLICWCTAEYVSRATCGIGIATDPAYERRGLATATAARFVAACLGRGVTPFWECTRRNIASQRVAEKLGFTLIEEALFYFGAFE